MNQFTIEELMEAQKAILSTIDKCEKARPKLKEGSSQHTLLVRRIKAFRIASSLIDDALKHQSMGGGYMDEYKRLLQTTNLQKGYQEFIRFFRTLRTYLQKELTDCTFAGNIVENNMDYSYFQFTNEFLKAQKLKIVITFVHGECTYQIWLSGMNRTIQSQYYEMQRGKACPYTLTKNPTQTDYIMKTQLIDDSMYKDTGGLLKAMKENVIEFVHNVEGSMPSSY